MDERLQRIVLDASRRASEIRDAKGYWPIVGSRFLDANEVTELHQESSKEQLVEVARQVELRAAAIHLSWEGACHEAMMFTLENDIEVPAATTNVISCINALSADTIDSESQFRWELDTAASFGEYVRVVGLLRAWQQKGMPNSYPPVALRMLYLMTSPGVEKSPLLSGIWDPALPGAVVDMKEDAFYFGYSVVAWAGSLSIDTIRKAPTLDGRASLLATIDRNKVRELRHWVDVAKDAGVSEDPVCSAVAAWTTYAIGLLDGRIEDFRLAGRLLESLPLIPDDSGTVASLAWRRWPAATLAYEDAGAFDDALRTARLWAEQGTSDKQKAWRKVAEIAMRGGQLEAAVPVLLKAIEDEQGEGDWRDRLIVELGLEKLRGDSIERALINAALDSPFRQQGEALTEWLLPWYADLAAESRQRLWHGLFTVTSSEGMRNTGQGAWDAAGQSFGEALAKELKASVFRPFFVEYPDLPVPQDGVWPEVRSGQGALGLIVSALLQSRSGNSAAAQKLSAWLYRNQPNLMDALRKHQGILTKATKLRNQAAHESLAPDGVRKLFEAVQVVLAALHSKSTRTQS